MEHFTDESLLLSALLAGEHNAYLYLYQKNKGWLLTTVCGILHDYSESEEVVQDVFLQVYQSVNAFNGRCTLRSWIYRIAVNKALNRFNHLKTRKRAAFVLLGDTEPPECSHREADAGEAGDRLSEFSYSELMWLVNRLPERQRDAFVMCKVQHRSYKEVAGILQCSIDSVAALMQRARHQLREEVTRLAHSPRKMPLGQVA